MTAPARLHRTAVFAASVALLMLGAAYAAVPLYDLFCRVTGFGGTTQVGTADDLPAAPLTQQVNVRFDATTSPAIPWTFTPAQTTQTIRIGAKTLAFYRAHNMSGETTRGTATFNVSPDTVGKYFVKIECFCFQEQTLAPGQTAEMPVIYYIDPDFVNDPDAAKVEEITLSYTFFPLREEPVKTAADTARRPSQG